MTRTLHLHANSPADVACAARLLREGRLVAFATETVYGLGANALSAAAVAGIFVAKQRPAWDPLIVHIASVGQLADIAEVSGALLSRVVTLAAAFWPGPLTLLLPRRVNVPDAVTAGRALVGVRVPAHPAAQSLLQNAELPIAAPSANLFGHTSPTTAAHVLADLDGRIDAVLDAGPTTIGVESSVLDPAPTPMILYRPGAITTAQLAAVVGVPVRVFEPSENFQLSEASQPSENTAVASREALPSPGVGLRHYAPRARLELTSGSPEALCERLGREQELHPSAGRVGVLLPAGWRLDPGFCDSSPGSTLVAHWGCWGDSAALAATLFAGLRSLDDQGATVILCPLPHPGGLADAIRDRLEKAARAR